MDINFNFDLGSFTAGIIGALVVAGIFSPWWLLAASAALFGFGKPYRLERSWAWPKRAA